jgi:hypothetical protein
VYRQRSVREPIPIGFVDDGHDAARRVREADWERRSDDDVGAYRERPIGCHVKPCAAVRGPRADGFDPSIEGRRAERSRPSTSMKTRHCG